MSSDEQEASTVKNRWRGNVVRKSLVKLVKPQHNFSFMVAISVLVSLFLVGCDNEDTSSDVLQTKEHKLEKLRSDYGSWEDFCKIRPECEDYPFGYETYEIAGVPYYFPLEVSKSSRPNYFGKRRPEYDFAQFSDDFKWFRRIVSLRCYKPDICDRKISKTNHRLRFSSGLGLYPLAQYLGISTDHETHVHGGMGGGYLVNDSRTSESMTIGRFLGVKVIEEIKLYQSGGQHDYDKNFWYISYDRDHNGEVNNSISAREVRFISKGPLFKDSEASIFANFRLYISCLGNRCSANFVTFPGDNEKFNAPNLSAIYSSSSIFPPRRFKSILTCKENKPNQICSVTKGLWDTLPSHYVGIDKIVRYFTTKPIDNDRYWIQ